MRLRQLALRRRSEHLAPSEVDEITCALRDTFQILPHELSCRLREKHIDFLQGLVLRLRREEQLVKPPHHGDTTVEAQGQADARHGLLHVTEEVRDESGAGEEGHVRDLHAVAAEVRGIDFAGQHPCEASVGAEEALVEDEACDIGTLCPADIGLGVDQIAASDDE